MQLLMAADLHQHSCPDLFCRSLMTPVEPRLTDSAFYAEARLKPQGKAAWRRTGPPSSPPPPPLLLPLLPHFSLFTSQECKSLKPPHLREGNQWRWCRDLKADPPCVSHRQSPHLPPPPPAPSEVLCSDRCCICAFSVCFYCVVKA